MVRFKTVLKGVLTEKCRLQKKKTVVEKTPPSNKHCKNKEVEIKKKLSIRVAPLCPKQKR